MLKEFREFIARGNVLELAVAVIIGAAFGSIIDSLVADISNPIIGLIFGQPDFSSVYINLSGQAYPT
ncbi:mechanosensitive ion channel protein MscL, partial [Kouleothrix aurantiaca]